MAAYLVVFGVIVAFTGFPTTIAFLVGGATSILAGFIGMRISGRVLRPTLARLVLG